MPRSASPQAIPMVNMHASAPQLVPNYDQHDTYGAPPPPLPRYSLIGMPDIANAKKSSLNHRGVEYQLIPVEIEKEAELGLVIGQVEGDSLIFIDEILPNGMIEMHGTLKEGDYLLQAGLYSLSGVDVPTALLLIEKAFDEGRKTVTFTAARADAKKSGKGGEATGSKPPHDKSHGQPPVPQVLPVVEIPEKQPMPSSQVSSPARRIKSNPRRVVNETENDESNTTKF